MTSFQIVNPATGEHGAHYPTATDAEIAAAIAGADSAFEQWRQTPLDERVDILRRVAALHRERAPELARIMAAEMGKPVRAGRGEIGICDDIYRYYADNAEAMLVDQAVPGIDAGTALIRLAPIGVILGIMPWNYPYYQVARFAAPNLLLGNTILLKHAPQCPESARQMERIFLDAGLPAGAYVNVFASNEQVADIIADDRVQGVSLTGSERAGAAVAEIAGRHLKKAVLELGGSDAFIVLDTDDVDALVGEAIVGRMGNTGQACNATKRFFVPDDLYDDFTTKLTAAVGQIEPGDPLDEATTMGPLASVAAATEVEAQVRDAVERGATVEVGGRRAGPDSAYYAPTVLTGVQPGMRAFREEIFGPVAVVYRYGDVADAITAANDSPYGLSASLHSADPLRALALADRLDVGMVFINESPSTAAALPFGGVKRSGYGRELGTLGIQEFANRKLVRAKSV
ncbi:NAD-dependent succinate-semialdehyde dehydrogenase [Gordonia sp. TBRC 11910]|uniref:NAD-dependent succinate-semialdehyde dehydrogenase n=1 Tax=Gordonia asplenii TaxID=2725283 RepID=A0A848L2Y0_9ACTN|nr:NAD-dependent succinate-semialdehyde dehydrogenase [Gordonia asplenii]NMO02008.1 NAD-dependent succinate-semialdehyde dehydrogenase [Gordonia asplenii]